MASSMVVYMLSMLQKYPEILISIAILFSLSLYRRKKNRSSKIPVNWPVVGMLPALLSNVNQFHDWSTDILRESCCTFLFRGPWFSGMDILITVDPANVNHVFTTNFSNYPKGDEFYEIFDILGDGIFNADGEAWRNQRRTAQAIMGHRRFRAIVADSSRYKVSKGLIPLLTQIADRKEAVDLQCVLLSLTFDLTCNLVFGVDPGCLSAKPGSIPFAKAMDDAMTAVFFRYTVPNVWWKCLRWMRIGEEKKLALARKVVDGFVTEVVSKRRGDIREVHTQDDIMEDESRPVDLLTTYIANEVSVGLMSEKFLRDTMLNFMLAGRDTTGAALTWFFWLLSKNPNVETRILKELMFHFPQKGGLGLEELIVFHPEELRNLVYLHAALCESLRLFPSVPFEQKEALQSEILPSGHEARRGKIIMFDTYAMGRMEGVWGEDCSEFKPERWISEEGKLKHEPSYKFLSFNSGPRTCLGKDVAFTQMKAVVSAMVYNFQVEVIEGQVVEPKLSIILQMKNGLMVRVMRRTC